MPRGEHLKVDDPIKYQISVRLNKAMHRYLKAKPNMVEYIRDLIKKDMP